MINTEKSNTEKPSNAEIMTSPPQQSSRGGCPALATVFHLSLWSCVCICIPCVAFLKEKWHRALCNLLCSLTERSVQRKPYQILSAIPGPLKNPWDNGVGSATLLVNILLRSDWLALSPLISTFLSFPQRIPFPNATAKKVCQPGKVFTCSLAWPGTCCKG